MMTPVQFAEVSLIGVGLAMDALAVSITGGMVIERLHIRHALRMAALFGLFQAIMPILGWSTGIVLKGYVAQWSHWVAFALLMIVGIKMILDARCDEEKCFDPLKLSVILGLAVATSIDAFAVGITFSLIGVTIWEAAAVIGGITFAISLAGTQLGKVLAGHLRNYTEIAGGLLLIAVGIRIVWVRM